MISYVKGTVAYIGNDCIVVDNNGIGYNIQVSPSTASAVVMEKEVKIYTYMNVKENELSLFGFLTKEELNMFNLLIGVNGVGPKSAVAMLGALSPSQLALAIATEDIKALSVGQGIGKKIAQRIALELKDKVGADTITTGVEIVQKVDVTTGERAEALSALMALGFTKNEAENAIKAVFVNGKLITSNGYEPKEGDIISVRKKGRFIYDGVSRQTKKGRLGVRILLYI